MVENLISEVMNESESSSSSVSSTSSPMAGDRLSNKSPKLKFKPSLYDKKILEELINSMDVENLRPKHIKDLRIAAKKQFGFYDKLCIVTERVKVFSNLFLTKRPKYMRSVR
jgi:hypothetical protein